MDLANLSTIKAILESRGLWAKKRFGQNFLISRPTLDTIIKTAQLSNKDNVIEIGPGLGSLTVELAKIAKKVTTIELDRTLIPLLTENVKKFTNIEIVENDVLKISPLPPGWPYKVVANIPYNITSPILNHFLGAKNKPTTMTLLVQKEVAEKLCRHTLEGKPLSSSILSIEVEIFGKPGLIKKIPRTLFFPSPKVDSAIIHVKTYEKSSPNFMTDEEALEVLNLAKKGFSQKRKKLRNTLSKDLPKEFIDRRPETLTIDDWRKLTKILK